MTDWHGADTAAARCSGSAIAHEFCRGRNCPSSRLLSHLSRLVLLVLLLLNLLALLLQTLLLHLRHVLRVLGFHCQEESVAGAVCDGANHQTASPAEAQRHSWPEADECVVISIQDEYEREKWMDEFGCGRQ